MGPSIFLLSLIGKPSRELLLLLLLYRSPLFVVRVLSVDCRPAYAILLGAYEELLLGLRLDGSFGAFLLVEASIGEVRGEMSPPFDDLSDKSLEVGSDKSSALRFELSLEVGSDESSALRFDWSLEVGSDESSALRFD
jgi:hypothetical protein